MIAWANISSCKRYRYSLGRSWGVGKKKSRDVCFIMLNPSTADGSKDDPTIRRCISLAKSWGYTGLVTVNLFALRSTNPEKLRRARDPVGPLNDRVILNAAQNAALVVCAWGNHGGLDDRDHRVLEILQNNHIEAYAMEVTARAQPKHPLYIKSDAKPRVLMSHSKATRQRLLK